MRSKISLALCSADRWSLCVLCWVARSVERAASRRSSSECVWRCTSMIESIVLGMNRPRSALSGRRVRQRTTYLSTNCWKTIFNAGQFVEYFLVAAHNVKAVNYGFYLSLVLVPNFSALFSPKCLVSTRAMSGSSSSHLRQSQSFPPSTNSG